MQISTYLRKYAASHSVSAVLLEPVGLYQ